MKQMILTTIAGLAVAQSASAQFSLTGPTGYATPTRPAGVAAGDFNGDGFADLAVATDALDKVSVMFNNGDGTFGAPVNFLTGAGTGAGHVVAADLVGGPELDLAVTLQNVGTVLVFQGDGAGGFVNAGTFAAGADPRFIDTGDFNGDGLIDMAVANRDSNDVSVLVNMGGGFTSSTIAVGEEPRAVAVGDYNGDGAMDIAVSNHRDRTVSVLNGNGGGGFALGATLPVNAATRPDGLVAADFNGDGAMDLASGTGDPSLAAVWLNNGAGLGARVDYATGGVGAGSLAAGDLDGDGDMDLAVIHVDSNNMGLLANNGAGGFGAPQMFATGTRPDFVVIADLGGSTVADIAVTNRDSDSISVYINDAAGACYADFNGDGAVNTQDVLAYLNAWNAGDASADCNGDGAINTQDVLCFLNAWNTGC